MKRPGELIISERLRSDADAAGRYMSAATSLVAASVELDPSVSFEVYKFSPEAALGLTFYELWNIRCALAESTDSQ